MTFHVVIKNLQVLFKGMVSHNDLYTTKNYESKSSLLFGNSLQIGLTRVCVLVLWDFHARLKCVPRKSENDPY